MNPTNPPHRWVAERTGYSVAGVSMLRSGKRNPTIGTMRLIENAIGWPVVDQVEHEDDWAEAFNQELLRQYEEETEK